MCTWLIENYQFQTFQPPIITNLPKEMSVLETQKGDKFLYKVDVHDPSVPPDPVCCTLQENARPKTVNFELRHNGSDYLLYTFNESVFSYHNINSYMLTVCCEDGFGTVQGIIKIDVKQMKAKKYYKPPRKFITWVCCLSSLVVYAVCSILVLMHVRLTFVSTMLLAVMTSWTCVWFLLGFFSAWFSCLVFVFVFFSSLFMKCTTFTALLLFLFCCFFYSVCRIFLLCFLFYDVCCFVPPKQKHIKIA